eukprot:2577951-Rhodomonas_salina.3
MHAPHLPACLSLPQASFRFKLLSPSLLSLSLQLLSPSAFFPQPLPSFGSSSFTLLDAPPKPLLLSPLSSLSLSSSLLFSPLSFAPLSVSPLLSSLLSQSLSPLSSLLSPLSSLSAALCSAPLSLSTALSSLLASQAVSAPLGRLFPLAVLPSSYSLRSKSGRGDAQVRRTRKLRREHRPFALLPPPPPSALLRLLTCSCPIAS